MKPNGRRFVAAQGEVPPKLLRVPDWHTLPQADEVTRRRQVWGLLSWYHRTHVEPYQGIRGTFRRLWNRLTGQGAQNVNIWDRLELMALQAQREQERQAEREAEEAARARFVKETPPEPTP